MARKYEPAHNLPKLTWPPCDLRLATGRDPPGEPDRSSTVTLSPNDCNSTLKLMSHANAVTDTRHPQTKANDFIFFFPYIFKSPLKAKPLRGNLAVVLVIRTNEDISECLRTQRKLVDVNTPSGNLGTCGSNPVMLNRLPIESESRKVFSASLDAYGRDWIGHNQTILTIPALCIQPCRSPSLCNEPNNQLFILTFGYSSGYPPNGGG